MVNILSCTGSGVYTTTLLVCNYYILLEALKWFYIYKRFLLLNFPLQNLSKFAILFHKSPI